MKLTSQSGQSLVEYLILVCLIAVSSILIVSTVGKNISEQYTNISRALTRGDGKSLPTTQAPDAAHKGRGMNDFMEGARKADD